MSGRAGVVAARNVPSTASSYSSNRDVLSEEEKDNAQAFYLRSVWLSMMLYGEMKLPAHPGEGQQGHGNSEELLLRDLGMDPLRYRGGNNRSFLPAFSIYQLLRLILNVLLLLFFGGFVF